MATPTLRQAAEVDDLSASDTDEEPIIGKRRPESLQVGVVAGTCKLPEKSVHIMPPAAAAAGARGTVTRPLPRVLVVHTGGTLGMDPSTSFLPDERGKSHLAPGTGGNYEGGLRPGEATP